MPFPKLLSISSIPFDELIRQEKCNSYTLPAFETTPQHIEIALISRCGPRKMPGKDQKAVYSSG